MYLRTHSEATTDFVDYIKQLIRKKLDIIIAFIGPNDLTKRLNTIKKVKNIVESIKKLCRDDLRRLITLSYLIVGEMKLYGGWTLSSSF